MNELDIVERLKDCENATHALFGYIFHDSRKEIERLRTELSELCAKAEGQAASVPEQAVATVEIGHMLDVRWIDIGWALKNLKGGEKLYLRPVAASVPDGWQLVPTDVLDRFPEINVSNYDHDDVCRLNAWGVELVLAAAPSPTGLDNPEAPNLNDKYTFVFPDASMTKIRYIFVDGEMVYENLESEQ